ncbi:MAG: hypothetical protein JST26_19725 [Bacteroidetes bacterium]|nr:hypothetical protein [Bacteroidota bacterium]
MKLKHSVLSILLSGLAFVSCKNDLKVLAPYKESVSVYGFLNANDTIQQIRINKVFLGEGDATVMAQNSDSINFPAGALTVTLERYKNGQKLAASATTSATSIVLTETVVATAPGPFSTTQRLYITKEKLFNSGDYKMTIKINSSGKEFTSTATILDSVKATSTKPLTLSPVHPFPVGTTPQSAYIDYSNTTVKQKIKFYSIPNARLYNVVMRFHYRDTLLDGSVNSKYADYTFPTVKSDGLAGNENLEVDFDASDFYANLANMINAAPPVNNLRNRAADYLEYIVYAGSQDLSDFLQVNAPSTTIAQDKPYYTNISNGGVGIFATRSRFSIGKDLANIFIDQLALNHYTCPLKFCNSSGSTNTACQ